MASPRSELPAQSPRTTLVSTDAAGVPGNLWSKRPIPEEDGRFVAFESYSTNLVAGGTNGRDHVFLKDLTTGSVRLLSVSSLGVEGNYHSGFHILSRDGSLVVFQSGASNLVPGDTNNKSDIFVHHIATGITERVSVSSTGQEGNDDSYQTFLSATGRFVGFRSDASNLVPNDTNFQPDVFVRDLLTGTTTLVSLADSGAQANLGAEKLCLSANGRYAAFQSSSSNLVPNDTNGASDVFVRDLWLGRTWLASTDSQGQQGLSDSFFDPYSPNHISDDGRYVVFTSSAGNFPPTRAPYLEEIYIKDLHTGQLAQVNVNSQGVPDNHGLANGYFAASIAGNGRFVLFESDGTNLDPRTVAGGYFSVYCRDTLLGLTTLVSVNNASAAANAWSDLQYISANGRFVGFISGATNLSVVQMPNGPGVYLHDRGTNFGFVEIEDGGCSGSALPPFLTSTAPVVGFANGELSGGQVAANSIGAVLLGFALTPPIPLGPRCELHVHPLAHVVLGTASANSAGCWQMPIGIPNQAGLLGVKVAVQSAFPGSGFGGIDISNGLIWHLGN